MAKIHAIAFVKTLDNMVEVKVDSLGDKLVIAEDKPLVDTLVNILAEIQIQTLG